MMLRIPSVGLVSTLIVAIGISGGCGPAPPEAVPPSPQVTDPADHDPVGDPELLDLPEPELPDPDMPDPAPGEEVEPEQVEEPAVEEPDAAVIPEPGAPPPAETVVSEPVISGDWPCWGGDPQRNLINPTTGFAAVFDPSHPVDDPQRLSGVPGIPLDELNIRWTAELGSQTYGNPVVSNGRVFVGTNNAAEYRPQHEGDRGVLLCFDEETGEFLWQLTREKMPTGRINDWPEQGIASTPFVEGDRMWLVTNRCELICLDVHGFHNGENSGPYTDEVDTELQDADIVWVLDMFEELDVFPHNLANSSPVVHGDLVYVLTSHGVDEDLSTVPNPHAPSFLAVNKHTGEVVWSDNSPGDQILHGQWGSPAIGIVNGQAQVYFPGGDGWLYALEAETGELIWKFDLNPKGSVWEMGGRGTRNSVIATPVFYEDSVVLGVGQDPEHGEGLGHIYRIDATKTGDVSPEIEEGEPNPNSALIWHLGGIDTDGTQTGEEGAEAFRRTLSTVAIYEGLVYAPDLSGRVHCIDFATGRRYWEADILAAVWGSPMAADGRVFLGDEDGILWIFRAGKSLEGASSLEFQASIYSTPTLANGTLFLSDRTQLYAIEIHD